MLRLMSRRESHAGQVELNVIPLIDVVFFLLVFYVISTSFMQETAVPIERPASTQASTVSGGFVPVAIVKSGAVQIGSTIVDLASIPSEVSAALELANTTRVLVIPDREVPTGLLLRVMDACQAGGAEAVDVAATKE